MALIIAGERSGVGKTTITLSILAFLAQQKNGRIQSFKVGPDYIDPMFHTKITGVSARNLDPILTSPTYVRSCFNRHSSTADYTLVEGVMGLFDGVQFPGSAISDYASTAHIARILRIPVLLVLDCAKLSGSIAAIAKGFSLLDPQVKIIGVVLNRVASDRHLELLTEALAQIQMPILGVLRRHEQITIQDRHLGLVPTGELPELNQIVAKLAHLAKEAFNWQQLLPLLQSTVSHQQSICEAVSFRTIINPPIRIAVARDRAFNFYYQDNLDLFSELGAEAIFWSPLADEQIPSNVSGFYFGGGFPEVFAEELATNKAILQQLHRLIESNIPVYAECGGLMYLCDRLIDLEGRSWQMVGSIPATTTMQARLKLGYRQIAPLNSTLNSPSQEANLHPKSFFLTQFLNQHQLWGHEFHRSKLVTKISHPLWQVQGLGIHSQKVIEGWKINHIHASYVHLHWGESKFLFTNWLDSCRDYRNQLA